MRQIMLDTETTGLSPQNGDRVIEIGCVEMVDRQLTGRHFHVYINPEREVPDDAIRIHGITNEFLVDKPVFATVVDDFEAFVRDAELVIHNAAFDVGFLNMELERLGRGRVDVLCAGVIDTLKMAREQNPGKRASLDALCDRHGIDNKHRTLHGALLDAELLAEVYLAMTRGQNSLMMVEDEASPASQVVEEGPADIAPVRPSVRLKVLRATDDELTAHAAILADIAKANKGKCLWLPADAVVS